MKPLKLTLKSPAFRVLVFICAVSIGLACVGIFVFGGSNGQKHNEYWWKTAQFYQIYPRSFKDSDGDGIGDLKGITSKLEYLKDIGVTAFWLAPIFKSPMIDFGYDISDFYDIQDEYGTIDDLRELINKTNSLGLKIILDFVPNHTSNESEWFKKSVQREPGYEDYYVWADGKLDENGKRIPPSNWLQYFRGSAWEWREERQQYYLHQYAVEQPDLNYRCPAVVEEMKRVLRFWLEQGVAGFRVDAVPNLFEVEPDADGQYPDAELSGVTDDIYDRKHLTATLIENQPENVDMVYQWRQVLDDFQRTHGGDTLMLLSEMYAPVEVTMQMYGNSSMDDGNMPFNFNFITMLENGLTAATIQYAIDDWLENMPAGRTANWVIGNHDEPRAATRFGVHRMAAMNMLVMTLPGASVTYQGEELGMIDGVISWEDTIDLAGCKTNRSIYQRFSRDPERTPFQWNAGISAGFSTSPNTWLPLAPEYQTLNVEVENASEKSSLKIYKSLVELRKSSKTLQNGAYEYKAINDSVFALKRYLAGENTIIYVANFGESPTTVDLQADFDRMLPSKMNVKISSLQSPKTVGVETNIKNLALLSGEALVLWSR